MSIRIYQSGGRFEETGNYARAKRVGPFAYVAGTTAIEPSGKLHAPGDSYAQTVFILDKIATSLNAVGANMRHVVRCRCYLSDMSAAAGFVKAHGEVFEGITPVLTAVQAGLTQPGMMVEIDVDAIVSDIDGNITFSE